MTTDKITDEQRVLAVLDTDERRSPRDVRFRLQGTGCRLPSEGEIQSILQKLEWSGHVARVGFGFRLTEAGEKVRR